MIFVTGDTHARFERFSSKNFPKGKEMVKSDYVIIAGDFGGIWDVNQSKAKEEHWLNWLNSKPWTTLFVDGNHENHDRLDAMPQREEFGVPVGVIKEHILHLKRGFVYTIQGVKIFTFGGGYSIDKARRKTNISWWDRELPNYREYSRGLKALAAHDNKVDYVITHTCAGKDFDEMSQVHDMDHKVADPENQLRGYFNVVQDSIEYKNWFCGHFHVNWEVNDTMFLYETIVELK